MLIFCVCATPLPVTQSTRKHLLMRKLLYTLTILASLMACSKSQDDKPREPNKSLVGDWNLYQQRADPGDGSGNWRRTDVVAAIHFGGDGLYHDSRSEQFNRYTFTQDTITLFNNTNPSVTYKLAVQELNGSTLSYYYGWPWCGGPSGEKFARVMFCTLPE
jgi:hypothetical protein